MGRQVPASAFAAIVTAVVLIAGGPARAGMLEFAWSTAGTDERSVEVAPGKFAELCGPLAAGQSVAWRFESDRPLDFNIHFHVGKKVRYPARSPRVRASSGSLAARSAQDYCWMWTNPSAEVARLQFRLQRGAPSGHEKSP